MKEKRSNIEVISINANGLNLRKKTEFNSVLCTRDLPKKK